MRGSGAVPGPGRHPHLPEEKELSQPPLLQDEATRSCLGAGVPGGDRRRLFVSFPALCRSDGARRQRSRSAVSYRGGSPARGLQLQHGGTRQHLSLQGRRRMGLLVAEQQRREKRETEEPEVECGSPSLRAGRRVFKEKLHTQVWSCARERRSRTSARQLLAAAPGSESSEPP